MKPSETAVRARRHLACRRHLSQASVQGLQPQAEI